MRIKKEKCEFLKSELQYLGHAINMNGVTPSIDKVKVIIEAPTPTNKQQLRSLLGMINFYANFEPELSNLLHFLHRLLQLKVAWKWSATCQAAFEKVKNLLAAARVLAHYYMEAPLQLERDASPYGVGAVLSHPNQDETTRPVAYASRSLTSAEQNYSRLEKEALAFVFGVRRFHCYLYGRKFVLLTDHKPLHTIFGPKKGIPSVAAARLQRWALTLAAYRYDLR